MTLQQFVHFDQYVRCFTFGKTDIVPVAYDPGGRRYLVDHAYLSAELGARIVRDAQTLNTALGYEMNTIEFAVEKGVPYAIDFLNPAPDFERDRITEFYFDMSGRSWNWLATTALTRRRNPCATAPASRCACHARPSRTCPPTTMRRSS